MDRGRKVNRKNVRQLAWRNGHHGVAGLARHIGRARTVIYQALSQPTRFGPTIREIEKALPHR